LKDYLEDIPDVLFQEKETMNALESDKSKPWFWYAFHFSTAGDYLHISLEVIFGAK